MDHSKSFINRRNWLYSYGLCGCWCHLRGFFNYWVLRVVYSTLQWSGHHGSESFHVCVLAFLCISSFQKYAKAKVPKWRQGAQTTQNHNTSMTLILRYKLLISLNSIIFFLCLFSIFVFTYIVKLHRSS